MLEQFQKYPFEIVTNKVRTKRSVIYRKGQQTEEEKKLLANQCSLLEDDDQVKNYIPVVSQLLMHLADSMNTLHNVGYTTHSL